MQNDTTVPPILAIKNEVATQDDANEFDMPQSAEQLSALLVSVESARLLLGSKLPLEKLRSLLIGCWIRYQASRDKAKNPKKDFYVDVVMHVNRDGIRFKNSRENSYRNIQKLREPDVEFNAEEFKQWFADLKQWNEPVPKIAELQHKQNAIRKAIEDVQESSNQIKHELPEEFLADPLPCSSDVTDSKLTRAEMSKLIITVDELVKLLSYGKDLFEKIAVGFYAEIRAPPNSNCQRHINSVKKGGLLIFMDEIIGISWLGKPYMISKTPMTLSLKFRHFRDEKLIVLPSREPGSEIDEKVFEQWLEDMREWEEILPSRQFVEQKRQELMNIFAQTPKGPPLDQLCMVDSKKHLKEIAQWRQAERQKQQYGEFPPPHPSTAAYHHQHRNLPPSSYNPLPPPVPSPFLAHRPYPPSLYPPYGLPPPVPPHYHPMAYPPNHWQSSPAYRPIGPPQHFPPYQNHQRHNQTPQRQQQVAKKNSRPQKQQKPDQRVREKTGRQGKNERRKAKSERDNLQQRKKFVKPPQRQQHPPPHHDYPPSDYSPHQQQQHYPPAYFPQPPRPPLAPQPYHRLPQPPPHLVPGIIPPPAPPLPVPPSIYPNPIQHGPGPSSQYYPPLPQPQPMPVPPAIYPAVPAPTTTTATIYPPSVTAAAPTPGMNERTSSYAQWQQECVKWF